MRAKKKKPPAQDSNQVGYGRPPVYSRFRKRQSGNPTGKRWHAAAEHAEAFIRKEAYRLLTVREGDKVTTMPALQAVWRSLIASAAKGNVSALRAVVKAVQEIEAEARARRTGNTANKKHNRNVEEMSDEELMNILKAAQNDKL
jgi:gamma-glutamyl:cysteine ligase YbdK (ATP-grasp superfamily)